MSNWLGIAAVTQTLESLLDPWVRSDPEVADVRITTAPPDKAREGITATQLNLFLYRTDVSAAWRNMDMPRQVKPNETGHPPLALNLYYLVTAYGRENDDVIGHRALARAMLLLHDHPVLGAGEIQAALVGNDLFQQVERVRITPQPMSTDEMSKLWTTLQTPYRISVAYEVAVVLLESGRPAKAPLPVLRRGPEDRGPVARGDVVPPVPTLQGVNPPDGQPSALLGDVLELEGHDLAGDVVTAVFRSTRLAEPRRVQPEVGPTATHLSVSLPDDAAAQAAWPPGLYTVSVEVTRTSPSTRTVTTSEVPLRISPVIAGSLPLSAPVVAGSATLDVPCRPEVRPDQRVSLLLGDREFVAASRATPTSILSFLLADVEPGESFIRLRVDGVDSLLIDHGTVPPTFKQDQRVVLT